MHVEPFLFSLFAATSLLYILHFGLYLAGGNIYDIWQLKHQFDRNFRGRNSKRKYLVTVAISAHNEEAVIERCLESIIRSTYPRLQIIVIDDGSKDATYRIVQRFISEHKDFDITLTRKYKNVGKGAALNHGLKRYARGKFAMTLDADSILAPNAIANAIAYFKDPTVAGVAANVQIIEEPTVLGILQKFEHMIGYRSKKVYSLTNCEFVIGGVASTYRMSVLKRVGFYDTDTLTEDIGLSMKIVSRGNRAHRVVYAVDVMAMTEGVDNFRALVKQRFRWKYGSLQNIVKYHRLIGHTNTLQFTLMLTLYRLPIALVSELALLCAPIIWGYALWLTFNQNALWLIGGAYMTITLYMIITLWTDEHIPFKTRLRLSMYTPVAYFMFYIMDLVQFIAVVRCLYRSRSLVKHRNIGSTWVSPRRIGRRILAEQ